ncbi:MAG: Efflux transporter, family [Parcubacteria group bacterium]|nr:Efflux transporter, family [Parcubacteria group bacterium]
MIQRFIAKTGAFIKKVVKKTKQLSATTWRRFRGLKRWQQVVVVLIIIALLVGLFVVLNSGKKADEASQDRTVTLATVGELSGSGSGVNIIGAVRSVTEADLLAQTGGTVRSVNTRIGATVGAGTVIAELENASERALVLQAEGSYDAAVASRQAVSPRDSATDARNAYRDAFDTLDTVLETQVDQLFGNQTPSGPDLLINPENSNDVYALPRERTAIDKRMTAWRDRLPQAGSRDPEVLLSEAETEARAIATFVNNLATAANERNSRATPAQITAVSTARASVNAVLAEIAAARTSYRSRSTTSTASVDASVKSALGSLRGAQAQLEKTVIRAPISGQVNFLPIHVGDYVTAFTHVATVAQNGALEIVAYISEDDRDLLTVGSKVRVEDAYDGIVTSIAPALDPSTKQIEIHVAVTGASKLVNGQSVRISLPGAVKKEETATGPILLPLAAVKLRSDSRIVFTVGEDGRLIAVPVEIGDVRGDRIEVLTPLDPAQRIVSDARGLSEGQKVNHD